jgi:hypothetical protein
MEMEIMKLEKVGVDHRQAVCEILVKKRRQERDRDTHTHTHTQTHTRDCSI